MSNNRELSQFGSFISINDGTTDIGIATGSSFVGIGTNAPTSKLDVIGNVRISGVVTASSFSGDASGLTNITGINWIKTTVGVSTVSNVGIGTTIPTSKLTVFGDVSVSGVITAVTINAKIEPSGLTTFTSLNVGSSGTIFTTNNTFVGIGSTQPTSRLSVGGDVGISGVVTATSFVGGGSGLTGVFGSIGIATVGGFVGSGVTTLDLRGPGVSTVTPVSSGIATVNFISVQGVQGTQGTLGSQGIQGLSVQGIQGIAGYASAQGSQGSQGTQGTQGRQGTQGTQGLSVQGTQGTQGLSAQGSQGIQGVAGNIGGVPYIFNSISTTDVNPGNGNIAYNNNITIDSVNVIYININDKNNNLQTPWYNTWDDSTSTSTGGYLTIQSSAFGSTVVNIWRITGTVTLGSGSSYHRIPVAYVSGAFPSNATLLSVNFSRTGDQGTQGTQGLSIQGTQGIQGSNATAQGTQGTQGTQGLSIQGIQGTQGTSIQGTQGTQGTQGKQGTQGIQGGASAQGLQGLQGTLGSQGIQGTQGTSIQGTQGTSIQGTQGTLGSQGIQGSQGTSIQGSQGTQGRQGTQGLSVQGTQGLQGTTGSGYANVTSNSSVSPASSGSISIATNQQGAFVTGNRVRVTNTTSNFFEGTIDSISGATFNITADYSVGTTNAASWTVSLAGVRGVQGTQGTSIQGSQGIQGTSIQGTQGTSIQGSQGIQGTSIQGTQGSVPSTVNVTLSSANATFYPLFTSASGNNQTVYNAANSPLSNALYYNPSTGKLTTNGALEAKTNVTSGYGLVPYAQLQSDGNIVSYMPATTSTPITCFAAVSNGNGVYEVTINDTDASINSNTGRQLRFTSATGTVRVQSALDVTGFITKGGGGFKILHPIVPQERDLIHSFIEGPRPDLIYRGKAQLVSGISTINMDSEVGLIEGTWAALCREPQVFLQNNDSFILIKGSITEDGILTIISNESCNDMIDWMVVAERHDEAIMSTNLTDENGRIILEPLKVS
jgi:hypothetical protein